MGLVEKALKVISKNKNNEKITDNVRLESFKIAVTINNNELVFENKNDQLAYKSGWLIGLSGEIYEITLSRYISLFIIKNDNKGFDVVRLNWRKGEKSPFSEKYRAKNVTFERALKVGGNYIKWLQKSRN